MENMRVIIQVLIFIFAWLIVIPLTIWNAILVCDKNYFIDSAKSIDVWANREFRTFWNKYLITDNGYKFGIKNETVSSVLGKNERDNTLSKNGKLLVNILNKLDKRHCENAIMD